MKTFETFPILKTALQCLALWVIILSITSFLWGLTLFFNTLDNVLLPIITAGVLSCLLRPIIDFFHKKWAIHNSLAIILIYITLALLITASLSTLLPALIDQLIEFITYIPTFSQNLLNTYATLFHLPADFNINTFIYDHLKTITPENLTKTLLPNLQKTGYGFFNTLETAISWCLTPIYLFYFLLSPGQFFQTITRQLNFLKPAFRQDLIFLYEEFVKILIAFFRGQIFISLLLSLFLSLSFTIIGLKSGALIGFGIGLLNTLPYVGTITGLIITLPIAFFQPDGGWLLTLYTLSIFSIAHILEAYWLSPKIIGKQTGLHPAVIIFSLFFWGKVFGSIMGLLLAVPLSAFLVIIWRLLKNKYLPQFNEPPVS